VTAPKLLEMLVTAREIVAHAIDHGGRHPDQAGQAWVEENRDKVDAWLQ